MRNAAVYAFATVLSIVFAVCLRVPSPGVGNQQQLTDREDLCWDEQDPATEPTSIDDRTILRQLAQRGGALVDQGEATDMQALVKQLELDGCELDLAPPQVAADDGSQLYARSKDSIVVVSAIYKCNRCNKWHATSATGFVISSSGAIATNHHVVDAADKSTLVVMTSSGYVVPVRRVLAASRADDLAIVQVDAEGLRPLPIAPETAPVGSPISVISHPAQRFYCYTSGVVSRYMKKRSGDQVVEGMTITADYARGSSGAPVLNPQGQIVGIVKSTDSIYYSVEKGQQKNLQMVFKVCIPATRLLALIEAT